MSGRLPSPQKHVPCAGSEVFTPVYLTKLFVGEGMGVHLWFIYVGCVGFWRNPVNLSPSKFHLECN